MFGEVPSLDQISGTPEEVLNFLKHHLGDHFFLEYFAHWIGFEHQKLDRNNNQLPSKSIMETGGKLTRSKQ